MEDMADLADMRHLLMERVQGVMATCCEFRNSLEHYSYLYVDDRKEFMHQFLLYGHILSSQDAEGDTDDNVSESPPSLDNFREQVDRWVSKCSVTSGSGVQVKEKFGFDSTS